MNWEKVFSQVEGKTLELKEKLPVSGDVIVKTCIAFANGAGGDIFVGVTDCDRKVVGVDVSTIFDWEEKLSNWIHTLVEPPMSFDFSTLNIAGKTIIRISISSGALKPYYLKNKGMEKGTYMRVGSTTRLVPAEILAELHRQRRNISFDTETISSLGIDSFDTTLLDRYLEMREQKKSLKNYSDQWLKLGAARKVNGSIKPTVGGLLVFCNELPSELSHATVEVTRFLGTTMEEIVDNKTFKSSIFDQIDGATKFLKLYIEKNVTRQGLRHEEKYVLPMDALREAVINAVCHRDYTMSGSNIKIAVFDNRVEITNPGALHGGLLISDLGSGISELRNRWIARSLHETGYMEQLGTGIQRMRLVCERSHLPPPQFQEIGFYFRVTLFRSFEGAGVDPDELKIINLLKEEGEISASYIAKMLGVHKNTATYKLNKLVAKGTVARLGRGRRTVYALK